MGSGIDKSTIEKPLVSVITVVFNDRMGISKTLDSVLGQSYPNIEYIVIDGGSTDGTKELIIQKESELANFISEPDQGIYAAMNKGISLANGILVGIINSGDYYEQNAVELLVSTYLQNRTYDIFHGLLRVFEQKGNLMSIAGTHSRSLEKVMIEHPTCFVKKQVYNDHGLFREDFKSSADYEFMLRVKAENVQFYFLEHILANFFMGGTSSKDTAILETLKIKEAYKLNSRYYNLIIRAYLKLRRLAN